MDIFHDEDNDEDSHFAVVNKAQFPVIKPITTSTA